METIGLKCDCGCERHWEACRNGVGEDYLAQSLYCENDYIDAFSRCETCSLTNYGRDCKNNPIEGE